MLRKIALNIIKHRAILCIGLFCAMVLYCLDMALSIKVDEKTVMDASNYIDGVKGMIFVVTSSMSGIIIFWFYLFLDGLTLIIERNALRKQIRDLKDEIGYLETEVNLKYEERKAKK